MDYSVSDDAMKSPILEQIADGLNKLGRRGSTLLKDFIEIEYMDLSDEEGVSNGLEEPGLHEVAGFGSLVLELPTPPREEPRPEVIPESPFETDAMGYPLAIFASNHLLVRERDQSEHNQQWNNFSFRMRVSSNTQYWRINVVTMGLSPPVPMFCSKVFLHFETGFK